MAFVQFRVGERYTNRDIVDTLHCDERAFLRSAKDRGIVAICLNADENLALPDEVWVGAGAGRERLTSALLSECRHRPAKAMPLFAKEDIGEGVGATPWRYLGTFRAIGEERSVAALATRHREGEPIVRVLYLARVRD